MLAKTILQKLKSTTPKLFEKDLITIHKKLRDVLSEYKIESTDVAHFDTVVVDKKTNKLYQLFLNSDMMEVELSTI